MKIIDINSNSVKKISNKELVNMHRRIHQLYTLSKKREMSNDFSKILYRAHNILVNEIDKRGLNHKSNLNEEFEFLNKYLQKIYS